MAGKRRILWWSVLVGVPALATLAVCCVRKPWQASSSPNRTAQTAGGNARGSSRGSSPGTETASAHPDRSPLGTNLAEPSYYSDSYPFVDAMKANFDFISGRPDHPDPSKRWHDGKKLPLTDQGWVRSLEPGQLARAFLVGADMHFPGGRYTVLYEGRGDIEYHGQLSGLTPGEGRDSFTLAPGSRLVLHLTRVDPSDPLRNIRVLFPGGRCANDVFRYCEHNNACDADARCVPFEENYEEQPFHPTFLSDVRHFKVLRFMDWMQTNRERILEDGKDEPQPIRQWREYPTKDSANWHPVPVDVMVQLANTIGADPWFTMPHQVDDDFVRRFARRVRDRLDENRRVYVEYSNEVWNDIFDQHQWVNGWGCRALSSNPTRECDAKGNGNLCEYTEWNDIQAKCAEYGSKGYARRTVQVMRIWSAAFGDQASARLVRVLAGQTGAFERRSKPQLDFRWDGKEPTSRHIDAYAIAPYFGADGLQSADDAFQKIDTETNDAPPGTYRVLSGAADAEWGGLLQWIALDVQGLAENPEYRGIRIIAYEGGQHFQSYDENVTRWMHAANRDPRMKDVYTQYLERWSGITDAGLFVHFSSPSAWSKHGSWGSKEYQGQPLPEAPKHDALVRFARP